MSDIFNHQKSNLKKLNTQRITWLILSVFFVLFLAVVFAIWEHLVYMYSVNLLRYLSILVITVTIGWWYWTMVLINKLLSYRSAEIEILKEITEEISALREFIKK